MENTYYDFENTTNEWRLLTLVILSQSSESLASPQNEQIPNIEQFKIQPSPNCLNYQQYIRRSARVKTEV